MSALGLGLRFAGDMKSIRQHVKAVWIEFSLISHGGLVIMDGRDACLGVVGEVW